MRRLRIFREGEHHATFFREARTLTAFIEQLDDDELRDGNIVYFDGFYWRIEHGEPRQLSPLDPRVQGLYGKAIRAEVSKRQTKPQYMGT